MSGGMDMGSGMMGAAAASAPLAAPSAPGPPRCAICQDAAPTVACTPCFHMCMCKACADVHEASENLNQCPICRNYIEAYNKVYF